MKKFHISPDLDLPIDIVTNTEFILARRRVGKSYTLAVIAEELVKAGLPWVILDPTGVHWGLGSSANGKSEGLPVIVIGGPHGHLPLEPNAGKIIANMVVDNPGWYVIDFSRFQNDDEQHIFSAAFGRQLYKRQQHRPSTIKLFVDEADMFVPQKPVSKNHIECFRAYDAIIRRGGVAGLGSTMVSQRPALINKDVLTQSDTLIILQTGAPQDQDPVLDWVSRNGTPDQLAQIKKTLASLPMGEAWYFSPTADIFKKIHIRERETFNSSATPKPGAKPIEPKVFSKIDLASLGEQIQQTVERSKQQDPEWLKRELDQAKREIARKDIELQAAKAKPAVVTSQAKPKIEKITVPGIKVRDLAALQKVADKTRDTIIAANALANRIDNQLAEAKALQRAAEGQMITIDHAPIKVIFTPPEPGQLTEPNFPNPKKSDSAGAIDGPEQKILNALAWLQLAGQQRPHRRSVAFLAGYNANGGGFGNPCSRLKSKGLITYHPGQTMELTQLGQSFAVYPPGAVTPAEIQAQALQVIGSDGPMVKIFKIVLQVYPDYISKENLALQSGYDPNGGGFGNPLSRLKTAGLVEYPQARMVRAAPFLFLE